MMICLVIILEGSDFIFFEKFGNWECGGHNVELGEY